MLYPCPKPLKQEKKARKYLRPVRKGFRAALEIKCNELWSAIVLMRCGYRCQHIDENGNRCMALAIDPHHIIRRSFKAVKFNVKNGMGLCRKHHDLGNTRLFLVAVRVFGDGIINELKELSKGDAPTINELSQIKEHLKVTMDNMKKDGWYEKENNQ